jgi:hypothetical protein
VVAFAHEINNGPVPLPNLNVFLSQTSQFSRQPSYDRMIFAPSQ